MELTLEQRKELWKGAKRANFATADQVKHAKKTNNYNVTGEAIPKFKKIATRKLK